MFLTVFADHLLAARCFEGIDGQLAADSAAKFEWDFILR